VVIAPDSFKGTVTAAEAAEALAEGWRRIRPQDTLRLLPLADGGEGTLAAVLRASPGARTHSVPGCTGPDGRPVTGLFALLPDGTAVVELATASGLPLLAVPDPLGATTQGTGETIAAALDHGAERLVVGVGGSASTDGGAGLLRALGLELYDRQGRPLPDGGGALAGVASADRSRLRPVPPGGVQVLTDVVNPLLGPDGAAAVYGPQKGADTGQIAVLEHGVSRLAGLLGGDPAAPGAGAAGGAAYGLCAVWGAEVVPGAAAVAELLGLGEELALADLVISGEGCFDATSLQGKVVGEVSRRAGAAGVPLAVVAGTAAFDVAQSADLAVLLTLGQIAGSPERARAEAAHWLREAGAGLAIGFRGFS
jgi:glycerate kinase